MAQRLEDIPTGGMHSAPAADAPAVRTTERVAASRRGRISTGTVLALAALVGVVMVQERPAMASVEGRARAAAEQPSRGNAAPVASATAIAAPSNPPRRTRRPEAAPARSRAPERARGGDKAPSARRSGAPRGGNDGGTDEFRDLDGPSGLPGAGVL
jgi:hypothetical protein